MKLDVPFYVQGKNECGQTALKMVLEFFGEKHDINELNELIDSEKTKASWTIGIARATGQLKFKTEFYSLHLGANPDLFDIDYYQKETSGFDSSNEKIKKLISSCISFGVELDEKTLNIEEIKSKINENCVAIVLLDWNVITKKEGYQGHFVPVVGFDKDNVYVHNAGKEDGAFFKIENELFDKARKAKGTDEDIVFIYGK